MDRIKDSQVIRLVEQISEQYQTNISNRFLRPLILQLQLDKNTWDLIELITEKLDMYRYQGFHLDDLYRQIVACAHFVDEVRHNLLPVLRNKLNINPNGPEKILREMAANNFPSNLQVFADLLNELYIRLVEIDKDSSGKKPPIYTQIPELGNAGRLLAGH